MNTSILKRPKIICHMAVSIDGKILSERWGDPKGGEIFSKLYETCHSTYGSQGWIVGRVTMERDFTGGKSPEPVSTPKPIKREAFIADVGASSFAIVADPSGKLGWDTNDISGDHLIEILTERVDDGYLNYLRQKNISYVFAGINSIDFTIAMEQLVVHFGIETLMLEGGGHLNGSFLGSGLIDELSILLLPIADGSSTSTTLFETKESLLGEAATKLQFKDVQQLEAGVLWIRYKVSE